MESWRIQPGLFGRMLIMIGIASIVPLVSVIAVAMINAHDIVAKESFRYAEELGERYANEIDAKFTEQLGAVRLLAGIFSSYRTIPPSFRRTIISAQVRSALDKSREVMAAWAQWEPGAIEDDPSPYSGTMFSAPNGGFDATWYHSPKGIVQGGITNDTYLGDFYTIPKKNMSETLTDPYYYSYTGKDSDKVLETSICVPIITDGKFKGVVGFDITLDTYQKIANEVKIFNTGYAAIISHNGTRVAHPVQTLIGKIVGDDLEKEKQSQLLEQIAAGKKFYIDRTAITSGKPSRQFYFPITVGNTTNPWFFVVIVPLSEITMAADRLSITLAIMGIIATIVVFSAIFFTAQNISRPITSLTNLTEKIAGGDLSVHVNVTTHDEIGRLTHTFNSMTEKLRNTLEKYNNTNKKLSQRNRDLRRAEESLKKLNAGLEQKVAERTSALRNAIEQMKQTNDELEQSLENLHTAQDQIIGSEKLAVLGQLVASIAHELNTPLGAIRSSAKFISESNNETLTAIPEYLLSLSESDRKLFILLVQKGRINAVKLSSPSDRGLKRKLSSRLNNEGFSNHDLLSDDVESLDAFDLEDQIVEAIIQGKEKIINMAAELTALTRAVTIIINATDKAAGTVSALVDYSRKEDYDISGLVEPVKEIETILVLYYNKLKHGITIERRFHCTDPVIGFRDRLNQVWINLVNNAVHAMEYHGTLTIATEREGEWIKISFTDTGPGIPDGIRDKIFQPFFTTKKQGEGTGLGLDICRKIIDRHKGSIELTSRPGETTFTVLLRAAEQLS